MFLENIGLIFGVTFSLSVSIPAKILSTKSHWRQFIFEPIISVVAFFVDCSQIVLIKTFLCGYYNDTKIFG